MKTKLFFLFIITISICASAEKLEISSTTTKEDLLSQLLAKQPTIEEIGEAWNEAYNLERRDLSDFLWPYMAQEQPLPQATQNEVKEEKSETNECVICCNEVQELITMPCCAGTACETCIAETSKGYTLEQVINIDGDDGDAVRTQDKYEIRPCPFCCRPTDLRKLVAHLEANPEEKSSEFSFLSDQQFAKLMLLAEASGIELDTYVGYLGNVDVEQIGNVIDANYETMVNPPRRTQSRPRVVVNHHNNNHNIQNAPQQRAPMQVAPLVLNADRANAQFSACQMVSSALVIVAAMLMYSQLGVG